MYERGRMAAAMVRRRTGVKAIGLDLDVRDHLGSQLSRQSKLDEITLSPSKLEAGS